MLKKLGVILMAAIFSLSGAGLSFAQEKPKDKSADKPAAPAAPAAKSGEKAAENPCGKDTKKKSTKGSKKKKTPVKKKAEKGKGEVPGPVEK
jgi:hypothetical protein